GLASLTHGYNLPPLRGWKPFRYVSSQTFGSDVRLRHVLHDEGVAVLM
ncbi:MAG: hypothetical protein QG656_1211, partial [Candidatus Hydrogenedentes bacterium]|nr:hypothetical protein [Candidatus Hydrogenedentota bacterium]